MDAALIPNERATSRDEPAKSQPNKGSNLAPNDSIVSSIQTTDSNSPSRSDSPTKCFFLGRYQMPSWCNWVFTRPISLLIFMCFIHFFQSSLVVGYMNAILSTLERQLGLHSKVMGLILSSFELSSTIV